jgi:hypothetical protein
MLKNHRAWMDYVRRKQLGVEDDELVLVYGWIKTSQWALTAFQGHDSSHQASIKLTIGPFASALFEWSLGNGHPGRPMPHQRQGPQSHRSKHSQSTTEGPSETRDQCVFVQYYKLKRKILNSPEVVDEVGVRVPQGAPPSANSGMQSSSGASRSGLFRRILGTLFKRNNHSAKGKEFTTHAHALEPLQTAVWEIDQVPQIQRVRLYPCVLMVSHNGLQYIDPLDDLLEYLLEVRLLGISQ